MTIDSLNTLTTKQLGKEESQLWAKELAKTLKPKTIVLLEGELGAGKTQWVQWMVNCWSPKQKVNSPTYSLINPYEVNFGMVYHVDLYRLKTDEEVESTGFWDLLDQPKSILFVEWPQRLDLKDLVNDWNLCRLQIKKVGGEDSTQQERSLRWETLNEFNE